MTTEYIIKLLDDGDNVIFETHSFRDRKYRIEVEKVEVSSL